MFTTPIVVEGSWYAAGSSRRVPARLCSDSKGTDQFDILDQATAEVLAQARLTEIKVSSRIGNTTRFVRFPAGKFTSNDHASLDRIAQTQTPKRWSGLAHRLESHRKFIAATAAFMLVFGWCVYAYGIPGLARVVAMHLPVPVTEQLTQETLIALDRTLFSPSMLSTEEQTRWLEHFQPLLDDYSYLTLQVLFRDGGDLGANALALPDGTMIFTDQLVSLAEHPDELRAILLHEIAHVHHRHGVQSVVRGSLMALAWGLLVGDSSATAELVLTAPLVFSELSYSRRFEREADDFARDAMLYRGMDTDHFGRIMLRLTYDGRCETLEACRTLGEPESSLSKYLSTHPVTEDRVQRFSGSAAD